MQESAPPPAPHVLLVDFSEGRGLLYCARSGVAPNKLKDSLQNMIDEQHVTLSEGRPYGLPTRTVTFQASRTCRWIVER